MESERQRDFSIKKYNFGNVVKDRKYKEDYR